MRSGMQGTVQEKVMEEKETLSVLSAPQFGGIILLDHSWDGQVPNSPICKISSQM